MTLFEFDFLKFTLKDLFDVLIVTFIFWLVGMFIGKSSAGPRVS